MPRLIISIWAFLIVFSATTYAGQEVVMVGEGKDDYDVTLLRTVLQEADDLRLHVVEGMGCPADFNRALFQQGGSSDVVAEFVRGL